MKKNFFLVLLLAVSAVFTVINGAPGANAAVDGYVVITGDDVMVYGFDGNYELKPMFVLPATYYVRYDNRSNTSYYIIQYMDAESASGNKDLFVLKTGLSVLNPTAVAEPYPDVTVSNSAINEKLYLYPSVTSAVVANLPAANCALKYLGRITGDDGESYYFVKYNAAFGYIREAALVSPAVIPPHPNSVTVPDPDITAPKQPLDRDALRVLILILGIILPAAVILRMVFRPNKKYPRRKPQESYTKELALYGERGRSDYYGSSERNSPPREAYGSRTDIYRDRYPERHDTYYGDTRRDIPERDIYSSPAAYRPGGYDGYIPGRYSDIRGFPPQNDFDAYGRRPQTAITNDYYGRAEAYYDGNFR